MQAEAAATRLGWIDSAKGIGILLVILGHAIGGLRDGRLISEDGVLAQVFYGLYLFHMPLFMALSGLLVDRRLKSKGRKAFFQGLIPSVIFPYLIWAPVAAIALVVFSGFTNFQYGGLAHLLVGLLWSPPGWFWFFYALFVFHALALLNPWGRFALLALAMAVFPFLRTQGPPILALLAHMFLFYAIGVAIGPILVSRVLDVKAWWIAALAAVFLGSAFWVWMEGLFYWSVAAVVPAIAGAALVMAISMTERVRNNRVLGYLGQRSLPIYVLHVFFVSGARILLARILGVHDPILLLLVTYTVGLVGPLAVYAVAGRLGVTTMVGLGRPAPSSASAPA